ncbi:hypothetical protein AYL99_07809 [Fonsecaea erecta]|uniref:Uncharacterized protein n=1 Tax=Fonsecaea erecta TaxID=1367422 RepID=A0A178ZFZ9_9EURO|nr:hypothetical protein AYL99_07809 [Fonsecaea erecta]OAP58719.1 hypothetical protein AYL99_07809 [Fonsecaea erecta]
MCQIKLPVCPYPAHDPVSSLLFNPKNAPWWEVCDKPRPWGRLSCGGLEVYHPEHLTQSENNPTVDLDTAEQHEKPNQEPAGHESTLQNLIKPGDAHQERFQQKPCCKWCTAVLRLAATKSKEMQKLAREEMAEVEKKMGDDAELRKMREEIASREQELDRMRHRAWRKCTVLMGGLVEKSGEDETQSSV